MIIEILVTFFLSLIVLVLISFIFISLFISLRSAPFVPTSERVLEEIFKGRIRKGQTLVDLGSGDGRVVRFVAKKFLVKAVGVELNPVLVWYSRLVDRLQATGSRFEVGSIYDMDLKGFDVIFLFLLPKMVERLIPKLMKLKGVLIISHGFKIKGFDKYLIDQIDRKRFSTYYYRKLI